MVVCSRAWIFDKKIEEKKTNKKKFFYGVKLRALL